MFCVTKNMFQDTVTKRIPVKVKIRHDLGDLCAAVNKKKGETSRGDWGKKKTQRVTLTLKWQITIGHSH